MIRQQSTNNESKQIETLRSSCREGPTRVGGLTDVGRVRELNEDNLHWENLDEQTALYAVADGMGGHDRGEVASRVAVDSLFEAARRGLESVEQRKPDELRELMREFMQAANRATMNVSDKYLL